MRKLTAETYLSEDIDLVRREVLAVKTMVHDIKMERRRERDAAIDVLQAALMELPTLGEIRSIVKTALRRPKQRKR